jgi:hypothetical protein
VSALSVVDSLGHTVGTLVDREGLVLTFGSVKLYFKVSRTGFYHYPGPLYIASVLYTSSNCSGQALMTTDSQLRETVGYGSAPNYTNYAVYAANPIQLMTANSR